MDTTRDQQQADVLRLLKRHGNVSRAARETGVNRRTINRWRQNDPVFGAAAEKALEMGRQ